MFKQFLVLLSKSLFILFQSILILLLARSTSLGHGMDEPGPHGGTITMPAAFHVEVLRKDPQTFHVWLLDMEFKNPTVQDSSVKAQIKRKKPMNLDCTVDGLSKEFYICTTKTKLKPKETLLIDSMRIKAVGNQVEYEFSK